MLVVDAISSNIKHYVSQSLPCLDADFEIKSFLCKSGLNKTNHLKTSTRI